MPCACLKNEKIRNARKYPNRLQKTQKKIGSNLYKLWKSLKGDINDYAEGMSNRNQNIKL